MDGRPFIDATTIGVLVALLVVVASILASRRKPVAPPLPRGDGIIVLECVQLEEHSRTAAAAAASTRWIRCHVRCGFAQRRLRCKASVLWSSQSVAWRSVCLDFVDQNTPCLLYTSPSPRDS